MIGIHVHTIGVYGYTEDEFFHELTVRGIEVFVDIRRRRGMRGSKYSFANRTYLQQKLQELGIQYVYVKELAPPDDLRNRQKQEDQLAGVTKRTRPHLNDAFVQRYMTECLDPFDIEAFLRRFRGADNIVLFCVESNPEACHRGLVAQRLAQLPDVQVHHIVKR